MIVLNVLTDRSLRYIFKLKNKLQNSVYYSYYFGIKKNLCVYVINLDIRIYVKNVLKTSRLLEHGAQ